MSQILGFKGTPSAAKMTVHVITVDGEYELLPPPGARFDWGHMGRTTTALARAIADELLGAKSTPQAAELIKRHFLVTFPRQDGFALDAGEVVQYVRTARQPGFQRAEVGAL